MDDGMADFVTVEVSRRYMVTANRADLYVTVKGTSLFTGDEALKKAREVAQLAADLTQGGLPPEAVFLEGVSVEAATGTVLKTSQANYRLRVHVARLDLLANVIGLIAAQKNAALRSLIWGYPEDDALRDAWLTECLTRANGKAARIAAALGVTLRGVHRFTERISDPEADAPTRFALAPLGTARARAEPMTEEDLGLEVSHTKTVTIAVAVEYRVSGFAE